MKKLYIFPVKYPFTNNIECFLHDEVPYLAKNFEEVIFVPLKKEIIAWSHSQSNNRDNHESDFLEFR